VGLLDKLFKSDPTSDWPAFGRTPAFDPERGTFGALRFGDPPEKARAIGRPSTFTGRMDGRCSMDYDPGGFELDFEDARFVGLMFVTGTGEGAPLRPGATPAKVSIGGLPVSEATTPEEIRNWFGAPDAETDEDDILELEYVRGKVVVDFQFDKAAGLAVVDILLDD
jgi:hypothetical protein